MVQRREIIVALAAALILTVGLQWQNHAFVAEWTDSTDEAAHYVTGLMVRDYITQGLPGNPMTFATRYYEHYPYIGFGHFPPVFYVVQTAWSLPFGISRVSLLVLIAVINSALLVTFYAVARRYFPIWLCCALTVFLATLPVMQLQSRMLIADGLVALLTFWSVLAFERYLGNRKQTAAVAFGLLAATTILTKGTGIALAAVPALTAMVQPRKTLLATRSFWLPALLVLGICAPWFLLVPNALHDRVARFGGIHFLPYRFGESFVYLGRQLHWAGSFLAAAGVIVVFRRILQTRDLKGHTFWLLAVLLALSCLGFRMTIGAWEVRHLLMILPFLLLFAGAGARGLVDAGFVRRHVAIAVTLLAVGVSCIINVRRMPPKYHIGLDKIAEDLLKDSEFVNSRMLIVSDTVGEGVFVGEIAMRDRRPRHVVERGSKVLATNNFMGDQYELNFRDPDAAIAFLEKTPGRIIILDAPHNPPAHTELIRATVDAFPERWETLAVYDKPGATQAENSKIRVLALKP